MCYNYNFYKFVLYKRYYATHHTVTTAIKRFFKVVQAQIVLQIEKSAGFQVVANLITVIKSVSKFELAIDYWCEKVVNQIDFQKCVGHNDLKLFVLITLFIKCKAF